MRKVGEGLSTPCLVALVQEGEITKKDVERHNAAKGGKSSAKNVADNAGVKAADDPKDVNKKSAKKKPKIAKTAVAADPANAKKVSKKAKTGAKAAPDKPGKTADKNYKKTKKAASAGTVPGSAKKGAGKSISTGKNRKSATNSSAAKPSVTKASSKKKAKKVPEEQAP
jgi:hypothetical protein